MLCGAAAVICVTLLQRLFDETNRAETAERSLGRACEREEEQNLRAKNLECQLVAAQDAAAAAAAAGEELKGQMLAMITQGRVKEAEAGARARAQQEKIERLQEEAARARDELVQALTPLPPPRVDRNAQT